MYGNATPQHTANWKPAGRDAKVYENILHVIGNTPLVKLNRIPKDHGLECEFYAKCEFLNPGGSIKDRMSYTMVVDAENTGRARAGTRFVEPTSGNTGIGISMTAAVKGYKAIIVTPDKNSDEKLSAMRLLGAKIVQTPAVAKKGDPDHFMSVAQRLVNEDPEHNISLDQYSNPVNPITHSEHTGREIIDGLGPIDMAVMGAGTGGTVTGVAHLLKRACPNCVVVAVDPRGSIMWGDELVPFFVEGIGGDFLPDVLDKRNVDRVEAPTDYEAFNMAREVIRKEGLLCGGSSGATMFAALKAAKELKLGAGKKVVVVLADGIRNYMTKFVSDQWMEAQLFKEPPIHDKIEWWNHPLHNLDVDTSVPHLKLSASVRYVIAAMGSVHSVAIILEENGLYKGATSKNQLRYSATNPKKEGNLNLQEPIGKHLIQNCLKVAENKGHPTVGLVSRILDITPFVVVVEKIPNPDSQIKGSKHFMIDSEDWRVAQMYSAKAKHISYGNWKPAGRDAKVYDNILQVVGNTPLVKLNRIPKDYGLECEFYAKCEFLNPGGSIKDRIASTLVHDAEKSGRAHDSTRFVEPTSGNTGIGLALTAAVKAGYKATIVTPDKNAGEKLSTLKLLEADIVQAPTSANLGDPDHFLTVAQEILKQDPNSICLDQFSNPANPMTHEHHTGSEIVAALGHVDMAVMGAGTGGTVTGIARALKKACPGCVIVAVEAVGSIIWGSELAPFYVEGIGDDFVPAVLEKDVIDKVVHTNDYDSFNMAREIIRKEGLLCGGSSGAAMFAALQAANELKLGAGKKVVVVLPDGIRNYMTKFVADQWMEAHLFKEPPLHPNIEWWNHPLDNLPVDRSVPRVKRDATCRDALTAMGSLHTVAIVVDENGFFEGATSKNQLRHAATNPKKEEKLNLNEPVKKHIIHNCLTVVENKGCPIVGLVSRILDITPFVVIVEKIPNPESKIIEIFKPKGLNVSFVFSETFIIRTCDFATFFIEITNRYLILIKCIFCSEKMSNHVASQNGQANGTSNFFNLKEMPHIVKVLDRNQKFHPDILHAIGNTPLVKLTRIPKSEGIKCDMYAKCEFMNPGGSVKDRIAYRMVLDAEQRGVLKPGKSVIIEPTSGNTGIGLALAAAVKGYRCIIVLPEKMSDEKVNTLKALGAEIVRTPTEAASASPESNISVAHRMATEIPDAVVLDQYNNPCNPLAHYDGTAEEILWALDDAVDMVVMGAGTSGTVSGVAHKVKERCPACAVVAVDPYGSILALPDELNHSDVDMYEVEGIGYDFLPRTLDRTVIDKWIKCDDKKALPMARRLIQEEGLLCGGSSGSAMWGALQAARSLKEGQKCVVLLPDNIRNYMTKHISDPWMEARQFKPVPTNDKLWWWDSTVEASLATPVPSVPLNSTPAQALSALTPSVPLATVVRDDGSVAGVFTADDARRRLANLSGSTSESLDKFLVKKYYKVDLAKNPTLGLVSRMLDIAPYVVVVKTDASSHRQHAVGVITSNNLLAHITDKAKMKNGLN
ncbi:uncharacterized protein LOC134656070 [Cydia amplana]|uniref:uncharacterized protein LOC134656070 n=1 Tax=Cydia amplana TaxID=1869771 RepID=UPI002FE66F16